MAQGLTRQANEHNLRRRPGAVLPGGRHEGEEPGHVDEAPFVPAAPRPVDPDHVRTHVREERAGVRPRPDPRQLDDLVIRFVHGVGRRLLDDALARRPACLGGSLERAVIERYTRPEMGAVWTERRKLDAWLQVELAVVDALAEQGVVPQADARKARL